MQFLNPLVLLGLAAASIPILLHLFNLRKLQTVEFSTLAFLKELQKTKIRKLKMTQLLLLLLRVLIVVFAVLAFARPAVKTSFPGLGARAKSSVVIIIDNSFSMEVADERGVRLKQAKDAALNIIKTLGEGDEVALVQMADLSDKRFFEFTRDFGLLREEIQKIPTSYTTAKLESALRLTSSIVSNSKNLNREVFIITDAQKNILHDEQTDSLKLFNVSTALYLIPIGVGSKAGERNLSVDSLHLITRIFEPSKPVEVEARIRNSGAEAAQGVIVSLMMNSERVAQRTVDIPAGETRTIPIAAAAPERSAIQGNAKNGLVKASVEVEGDVLDADNRRYFAFVLPEKPRIGIVGISQETNFLALALAPDAAIGGKSNVLQLPPEALSAANLNEFDALYLVNLPRFSISDIARLQNFLQNGGGVFIFAGDKSDIASYNSTILSAFQLGQAVNKEYRAEQPAEFSFVDKSHPLFTGVFKTTSGQSSQAPQEGSTPRTVESPKLLRALPLIKDALPSQALIDLPDGVFLAESKISNGKVFYCAAPPTTNFGNFPITGMFVTIVNRAAMYLTATATSSMESTVGQPVNILLSGKYASGTFTVFDPNNTESVRQPVVMPSGASLALEALRQPGVYSVQTQDGKIIQTLSVNPPASESAITLLMPDDLVKEIAKRVPKPEQIRVIEEYQNFNADILRAGAGTELWKFFVMLAILCAIAEMVISRRAAAVSAE